MANRPRVLSWLAGPVLVVAVVALPTGTLSPLAASPARADAATAAGTAQNCSSAPAGDAFYTPPSPLPAGQHGDIIWCRQVASPAAG